MILKIVICLHVHVAILIHVQNLRQMFSSMAVLRLVNAHFFYAQKCDTTFPSQQFFLVISIIIKAMLTSVSNCDDQ